MLGKLSIRNMKRSAKDYQVYILTMTLVAALMYAFGSLIFQNDLSEDFTLSGSVDLMSVMIGLATFFVVLIVKWLIHYMVRFMLEKRSTEFGIYLLLGMKKRQLPDCTFWRICCLAEFHCCLEQCLAYCFSSFL